MPRRVFFTLLVVLVSAAFAVPARAAIAPDLRPLANSWTLLGGGLGGESQEKVSAATRSGQTLYLGGDFAGLGRRAPGFGAFDPDSGRLVGPAEQLDLDANREVSVTAAVAAADGSLYVAGSFGGAGGVAQPRVLRMTADGRLDPAFEPDVTFPTSATVSDLALSPDGRRLYIAGEMSAIGGQSRAHLAAVDARTGAVSGWQPQLGGPVTRVVAAGDAVYVAGTFTTVRTAARNGLAALAASDGAPTAFDPKPNAAGLVNDLAVSGSTVYVAGLFSTLQGAAHPRLAAVDATTGVPTSWAPPISGTRVAKLALTADKVYVTGSFSVAGTTRQLAAFDRGTGADTGWTPALAKEGTALTVDGNRVYVGYTGKVSNRCGLAAVDATTGALTAWDPHVAMANNTATECSGFKVNALLASGGRVWAGGTFTAANVAERKGAAAIDLTTGDLLPWAPDVAAASGKARVNAIAISNDGATAYLGGTFTSVGGQSRGNLAAVPATGTGAPTVTGWANAVNGQVRALAVDPRAGVSRLYVGGTFTAVGQFGRLGIASVSATSGGVSSAWKPQATTASGAGASVRDLAVGADGTVYLAGSFAKIGVPTAVNRAGLAAVVGDGAATDTGVATAFDAGLASGTTMLSLALTGDRLYASGAAGAIDATTSVAAFDPVTGARNPAFGGRANSDVYRVTVDGDSTVYVIGNFTTLTGPDGAATPRRNAGAFTADGTPTAWAPEASVGVGDPVPAGVVAIDGGVVYGGSFASLASAGIPMYGLAFFGSALAPVAGRGPTIAGTAGLNKDLRCDPGRFSGSPGTSSWTWNRDSTAIVGASSTIYTLRAADLGHAITCTQTVTNTAGSASATSDALAIPAPPPEIDTPPSVAGQLWPGGVATCTTGLWRNVPTAFAYTWFLDGTPLAGEDDSAHAIAPAEQGHALSCAVTASSSAGTATAGSAPAAVTEPPPALRGAPRIGGSAIVGGTVACDAGAWDGARTYSYIWLRDGAPVDGRTAAAYVVSSKDLGHALVCVVTARNDGGEGTAQSAAVLVTPSAHTEAFSTRPPIPEVLSGDAVTATSITKLDVKSSTLAKTGRRLVLRVAAPVTGTLTVTLKNGKTTYGKAKVKVKRRATMTVRVALSTATARRLRRGALTVTVAATLKPIKGPAQTDRSTLHLSIAKGAA